MRGAFRWSVTVAAVCSLALLGGCGLGNRYRVVAEWSLQQEYYFNKPIALWAHGNDLYVLASGQYVVQLTRTGDAKKQWGWQYLKTPTDLAFDSRGNIYVSESWHDQIFKFSRDGKLLGRLGGPGEGPGMFRNPASLAPLPDGGLFVYDIRNEALTRFDASGRLVGYRKLRAWEIATDRKGNVYALLVPEDKVRKMTPDGRVLATWGGRGSKRGQMNRPQDIAVDSKGNVYVADTGNQRVQIFTTDGKLISWFGPEILPGRPFRPAAVTADEAGYIYLVNAADSHILKIAPPGMKVAGPASQ
jgi:tripartite motif-containing protein 71